MSKLFKTPITDITSDHDGNVLYGHWTNDQGYVYVHGEKENEYAINAINSHEMMVTRIQELEQAADNMGLLNKQVAELAMALSKINRRLSTGTYDEWSCKAMSDIAERALKAMSDIAERVLKVIHD